MTKFDLVVVGVTGSTGQKVFNYLTKINPKLKIALAARDINKIGKIDKYGVFDKIETDLLNPVSVANLCDQTKCVLNLAGPYSTYGEEILKSCASSGVDYVDITGENNWIVEMSNKYGDIAKKSGARILMGCGFMCTPFELAIEYANEIAKLENMKLKSVIQNVSDSQIGSLGGGTLRSLIGMYKNLSIFRIFEAITNPFFMCKETKDTAKNCKLNRYELYPLSIPNGYKSISTLGPLLTAYLRWANEKRDYAWGENLIVKIYETQSNIFSSVFTVITAILMPISTFLLSRIPFIHLLFPKSGNNIKIPFGGEGFKMQVDCKLINDQAIERDLNFSVVAVGDMANLTACCCVEAALCVLKSTSSGGITSSSVLPTFLAQMINAGLYFETH